MESLRIVNSENRKKVLVLARDSHRHRLNLEKLLKILNLEPTTNEIPDVTFDFEEMVDGEILQRIIEQEELARDLYTELVEKTDLKLVKDLSGGKDSSFFLSNVKENY